MTNATTFVDHTTVIPAAWLNDVDAATYRNAVNVMQYGAAANGTTDDATAFAAAFAAVAANGLIIVPPGSYKCGNVDFTGKAVTVSGYGASINTTSASGAFSKTDHSNKLTVIGLRFTGAGVGIKILTTTSVTQFEDYHIQGCRFENADYGIYTDGAREGRVVSCSFEGTLQKGIYRVRSVNLDVTTCYWKNTVYMVNDDGDGSAFSAGLKVIGGTAIGCSTGIRSSRTDQVQLLGVVIDYCDTPVTLIGVDGTSIVGNYISTRTANPAIAVDQYSVSERPQNHRIVCNELVSHGATTASDGVTISNAQSATIEGNTITFWWRYGVRFDNCTNVNIVNNNIEKDGTSTVVTPISVYESAGGDSSNTIRYNEFSIAPSILFAQIECNRGYTTQNSGEATSGTGVTSFTVAHALAYTPANGDIQLTPTNSAAAVGQPYLSAVDSTNITISFVSAVTTAKVAWSIKRRVFN